MFQNFRKKHTRVVIGKSSSMLRIIGGLLLLVISLAAATSMLVGTLTIFHWYMTAGMLR